MSQVNTSDATFAKQTAIAADLGATLWRQARTIQANLQHIAATLFGDAGRSNSDSLSTYYADAYDRTSAATPVTSLRDISGI